MGYATDKRKLSVSLCARFRAPLQLSRLVIRLVLPSYLDESFDINFGETTKKKRMLFQFNNNGRKGKS
jgi:hypothetical protein